MNKANDNTKKLHPKEVRRTRRTLCAAPTMISWCFDEIFFDSIGAFRNK